VTQTSETRTRAFDALVAVAFAALNVLLLIPLSDTSQLPVVAVLVVAHAGCLFWRRRAPMAVLVVNIVSGLAVLALGYPSVVLGLAAVVAIYTVAAISPRATSIPAVAVLVVVTAAAQLVVEEARIDTVLGNLVVLGVAWFFGDSIGQRRDYVRRLEERTAELEQARDELARSAVVEERLRIARELHDILGHSVGVIAVQAGVGAHVIDDDPTEAKRSLEAIESVSKSALGEIRQVLGALREDTEPGEVRPQPGVSDLAELVAELPSGNISVELDVDEKSRSLPAGLQLTIYRVVQEALTNVMRHSGARLARVSVRARQDAVDVEVVDDGAGSSTGPGHGIRGMSERVAIQGGRFDASSLQDKGFRVSATFPIAGSS
jgi:signal transduction histidine kinase